MIDILDQIHSLFLHSFDIGYRLTNNEKQLMLNQHNDNHSFYEIFKILNNKRKIFETNIVGSNQRLNHSKFMTKLTENNYNDDIHNTMKEKEAAIYSFCHQFDYWDDDEIYDELEDELLNNLSVPTKYPNLKYELLNNAICAIQLEEWNTIQAKAEVFLTTNHARKKRCNGYFDICYYGSSVQEGERLHLNHLVALILYTDLDLLAYNFSKTFRFTKNNQTLKQLISIHSNYFWMAKYLREAVESYGELFN
eukprot:485053_1